MINKKQWENVMRFDDNGLETIITGDFNAHNILWNCQDTDANGDNLCETMDNAEMICLNQETESRLGNRTILVEHQFDIGLSKNGRHCGCNSG